MRTIHLSSLFNRLVKSVTLVHVRSTLLSLLIYNPNTHRRTSFFFSGINSENFWNDPNDARHLFSFFFAHFLCVCVCVCVRERLLVIVVVTNEGNLN